MLIFSDDINDRIVASLGVLFFGIFGIPSATYQLIKSKYLKVDSNGFEVYPSLVKSMARTNWIDTAGFKVVYLNGVSFVEILYSEDYEGRQDARSFAKNMSGAEGALETYGGMSADAMCDFLNTTREHYLSERGTD